MCRARHLAAVLTVVSATATAPVVATAQAGDPYADLARHVVRNAVGIKPGAIVWINGGTTVVPFMDALGAEVTRAGAVVELSLQSERTFSAFFRDLPEKDFPASDSASATLYRRQLELADVIITLPSLQDQDTLLNSILADSVRFAKVMRIEAASQQRYDAMRDNARTRFVTVNYPPSRTEITKSGMDSASFDRMIREAVTTDYGRINTTGQRIKRLLETGKVVHVTTPDGTDFRLTLAARPAVVISNTLGPQAANAKLAAQRSITLTGGRVVVATLECQTTSQIGSARILVMTTSHSPAL
jgi:leucyl aminopeptidase (aminopeptidase T)